MGPSQWEAGATYSPEVAAAGGMTWLGPTGSEFAAAYKARYQEEPSYHSVGGYAAGLILEHAIRSAGAVETDKVRAALDAANLMTFFGPCRFDTGEMHGLQTGHEMVYIQWQRDADGTLAKHVVWPPESKTADPKYPLR